MKWNATKKYTNTVLHLNIRESKLQNFLMKYITLVQNEKSMQPQLRQHSITTIQHNLKSYI